MEQTKRAESENGSSFERFGLMLTGLVVSAGVLLTVFRHWHGYDFISKFLALALISYLLVPVAGAIRGKNSDALRVSRAQQAMWWGYMSLMLATMLFSR
jgi:hypothetical protein